MAESDNISASETMALILHEDPSYEILRFNGGSGSGPAVGVISVVLESPFVVDDGFIYSIPLFRYGPAAQIGETIGHVACKFGRYLVEIIVRQVQVDGLLHFLFLLRRGVTGPWTFQKSIFNPQGKRPCGRKEYYNDQVDKRRVKGGNDFTAYVINYGDGATGEAQSYNAQEDITGEEYLFLLHGLADDWTDENSMISFDIARHYD
ncbi:hypothetical protein MMC27_007369 [Xylographa pallens]|nr:hypothetical protein [Xylographa pallens]